MPRCFWSMMIFRIFSTRWRTSRMGSPWVGIGAPIFRSIVPGRKQQPVRGSILYVPEMEMGTIGIRDWRANRNAPLLNPFTSPSGLRVPSGKTTTETPCLIRREAFFRLFAAEVALSRSMRTCLDRYMNHPKIGNQIKDFLAINRTGRGTAATMAGISRRLA